ARLRVPLVDRAAAEAYVRVGPRDDRARGARAAADVEHGAVGRDRQAVRLAVLVELARGVLRGQALGLVVRRDRGLAVAAHDARRPLQRAEQVVAERLVRPALGRAAHAGEERAAAVVVAAPRDGLERRGRRAGVRAGLDRRDGVHVTGRVLGPLEPPVLAVPREREVRRRRVLAVDEVDRALGDGDLLVGLLDGVGPEQGELGELDLGVAGVRGDDEAVPAVLGLAADREGAALEALRERLTGPGVDVDPRLAVRRALDRPVPRVAARGVVRRRQAVLHERDRLLHAERERPRAGERQPLGAGVAVDGLGRGLGGRAGPGARRLGDLLRDRRRARDPGADEALEPLRRLLGARGVAHAEEPAARVDVRLEGGLLRAV